MISGVFPRVLAGEQRRCHTLSVACHEFEQYDVHKTCLSEIKVTSVVAAAIALKHMRLTCHFQITGGDDPLCSIQHIQVQHRR